MNYTLPFNYTAKDKLVTLTGIHVILVALSQGLVTLPCSDMVCWLHSVHMHSMHP